jgi:hypothetical protein
VALSQARILYQNHSGDYPQVILTIPVTCRTAVMTAASRTPQKEKCKQQQKGSNSRNTSSK